MKKITDVLQMDIGFSWKGLLIFLLPLLPNILFLIKREPDMLTAAGHPPAWDLIEHISQGLFAALLIFTVSRTISPFSSLYLFLSLLFLLSYYGLWIAYFTLEVSFPLLVALAVVPVIYFLMAELWLHNLPAAFFTVLFAVVHIAITYRDYRLI